MDGWHLHLDLLYITVNKRLNIQSIAKKGATVKYKNTEYYRTV